MLAQLLLVSVLFHVLHSILAKITWGGEGKETRGVLVTNIKGDRTALDYKLE